MKKIISILSFFMAIYCIAVAWQFTDYYLDPQQSIWTLFPQPGIYLLEVALLGILAFVACVRGWPNFLWVASGILSVLSILGMWSFGLLLIPPTLFYIFSATQLSKEKTFKNNFSYFIFAAMAEGNLFLISLLFLRS